MNHQPCGGCGGKAYFKGRCGKTLLTVVGEVAVSRRYYHCRACHGRVVPFDRWAGLPEASGGMATPAARRMLSLAGMSWSFDAASGHLAELCLLRVSNDTIRRVSEDEGRAAAAWVAHADAPARAFAAAAAGARQQQRHDAEFYTDGVTVNTTGGWRDLRVNIMARRPAGAPATPAAWADRVLPAPSVRLAWASMAACDRQGVAWKRMSERLGVADDEGLSVLADGAKWIWDQAGQCWKRAAWVLDVFHVSQHVHDCGKALFGERDPARARRWSDDQVQALLEHGAARFLADLATLRETYAGGGGGGPEPSKVAAVDALLGYLRPHVDSMPYRARLAAGRAIGSGLVEGANKSIVSNRLKLNSARWTPDHAEDVAALRCLDYSGLWPTFWAERAA